MYIGVGVICRGGCGLKNSLNSLCILSWFKSKSILVENGGSGGKKLSQTFYLTLLIAFAVFLKEITLRN